MHQSEHLKIFAQKMYPDIIIHPDFLIEDRYVFLSNRFLRELNDLTKYDPTQTEIINIEYDEKSGIPSFILIAKNEAMEDFFDKWHVEFMAAYMLSCFGGHLY